MYSKNENSVLLSVRGSSDQTIALPSLFDFVNAEEILPHVRLVDSLPRMDCGEPPTGKYAESDVWSWIEANYAGFTF